MKNLRKLLFIFFVFFAIGCKSDKGLNSLPRKQAFEVEAIMEDKIVLKALEKKLKANPVTQIEITNTAGRYRIYWDYDSIVVQAKSHWDQSSKNFRLDSVELFDENNHIPSK